MFINFTCGGCARGFLTIFQTIACLSAITLNWCLLNGLKAFERAIWKRGLIQTFNTSLTRNNFTNACETEFAEKEPLGREFKNCLFLFFFLWRCLFFGNFCKVKSLMRFLTFYLISQYLRTPSLENAFNECGTFLSSIFGFAAHNCVENLIKLHFILVVWSEIFINKIRRWKWSEGMFW